MVTYFRADVKRLSIARNRALCVEQMQFARRAVNGDGGRPFHGERWQRAIDARRFQAGESARGRKQKGAGACRPLRLARTVCQFPDSRNAPLVTA
ncbi:MAG: hypothetical protein MUC86_00765 [Burkholderiaceae bacterium]|jgi:hypothetical protein|nr:hypothetical protein [Burkholderiaceae bacterium]